MIVLPYLEYVPRLGVGVVSDSWAAVIGRVEVGDACYLGPLATLRADGERVRVGSNCWFGEASTVHIADSLYPALVGSRVTVGRFGLVHACMVEIGRAHV